MLTEGEIASAVTCSPSYHSNEILSLPDTYQHCIDLSLGKATKITEHKEDFKKLCPSY